MPSLAWSSIRSSSYLIWLHGTSCYRRRWGCCGKLRKNLVSWWWKRSWYHCNQLYFGGKPSAACVEKAQRVWLEGQPGEVQIPQKLCGVFGPCYFCRRLALISQESQGHHRDAKTARSQTIPCLPWHGPVLGQVPTQFGYSPGSTPPVVTEGGGVVAGSWGRI